MKKTRDREKKRKNQRVGNRDGDRARESNRDGERATETLLCHDKKIFYALLAKNGRL